MSEVEREQTLQTRSLWSRVLWAHRHVIIISIESHEEPDRHGSCGVCWVVEVQEEPERHRLDAAVHTKKHCGRFRLEFSDVRGKVTEDMFPGFPWFGCETRVSSAALFRTRKQSACG